MPFMPPTGEQCEAGMLGGQLPPLGVLAILSAEERATLCRYATVRRVAAGHELWAAGNAGDFLVCVLAGAVELKVDTEFPGKQIVVGVFNPGTVIGASCVLDQLPRPTTAKALEATTLLILERERFDCLVDEHQRLGIKLLKGLLLAEANRLRKAYARLASIF